VTAVAPLIVNDVSYATRIKHAIHFAWHAQYLVRLEGDTCCSAPCKRSFICDEVKLKCHFLWQAYLVKF